MTVSGVILTLNSDPSLQTATMEWLAQEPRIDLGPRQCLQQAVVLDAASRDDERELWNALRDHPGIDQASLTGVFFDEAQPDDHTSAQHDPEELTP